MSNYARYLDAAERENTRRSYHAAVKHFEEVWGGVLPTTAEAIARYLAEYAETLSLNTLKQRVAALARWHQDQGFADPTKSALVRRVLRGIGEAHGTRERRAVPVALETLSQVDAWLLTEIDQTRSPKALAAHLRAHRDRALLLLGFWRAFRTDELLRLWVEHIEAVAGHGMVLYLPRTKTVSALKGREYKVPALSRLCPVQAYLDWIAAAEIERGPVFRRISANGALGSGPLHPSSLAPLLRARFRAAGVADADGYSGHSLRRGFATWASERGWDTRELMDYVGWSDVSSATRYVERADVSRRARLEEGLAMTKPSVAAPPLFETSLEVSVLLERDNARVRSVPRARRYIERSCLAPHAMQRLDDAGARYRIRVLAASRDELDETLADLLEQMHTIAANNQCVLDAQIRDEAAGKVWD